MDWNDLRFFLAVARAGTLMGAGRELGVEHTTVSRRIAALETALGTRLFQRGPEGFTLTEAGADILRDAEAVLERTEAIKRRAQGADTKVEGTVRLTLPESIASYMIEELAVLRERHPALLVELLTDNRELDLRRGEADVALRLRDVTDGELTAKKIGQSGWSLYASAAYLARKGKLKAADQLAGHDVIGFDASLSKVEGALWLDKHGAGANVVLRGNNLASVQSAAAVGFGIAPLPCITADRDRALLRLTPALIGSRTVMLVAHPDLTRVARVRATMDFLSELFRRHERKWSGVIEDDVPPKVDQEPP